MRRLNIQVLLLSLLALAVLLPGHSYAKKKKVLVFCKTAGFHHQSIKQGIAAIQQLGLANNFEVDSTIQSSYFNDKNLKQYAAVIFLSTTGNILDDGQQQAFEKYIQAGGGYVGIHAASDCEYDWPWYGNLVGAYFSGHPAQQEAVLEVLDRDHLATRHLPEKWKRKDEWYNFRSVVDGLNVLINIDEDSYDAGNGKMGDQHPMSWYREFDGGRVFYTALGHTEESFAEPLFLDHLLGGIRYAMGEKNKRKN